MDGGGWEAVKASTFRSSTRAGVYGLVGLVRRPGGHPALQAGNVCEPVNMDEYFRAGRVVYGSCFEKVSEELIWSTGVGYCWV